MKKILIIVLTVLMLTPCFARTFTEEEFYEVYDALQETTLLLEDAGKTIKSLNEQIADLSASNQKLIEQLNSAKSELQNAYTLLDNSETELKNSAKVIDKLNNQNFLLGGGLIVRTDFREAFNFGFNINAGYKIWIGYLTGNFSMYNDKSMNFGLSYNIVF